MTIKAIISDFDGVLSTSKFYNGLDPELSVQIQNFLFSNKGYFLTKSWMHGEISFEELHLILGKKFNIASELLNQTLVQDVKDFEINWDLIHLLNSYKDKYKIPLAILTDNMDVFDRYTVPHHKLDKYFDFIVSSSNASLQKVDNNWQIIQGTINRFGVKNSEVLIIDDSKKMQLASEKLGFKFYLYNSETKNDFKEWLENEYCNN